jgi:hypothetical protein
MGYRGYNIQAPEDRTWLTPSASGFANAPPDTPEDGLRLIVGTEPTGAFADHANDIVDRVAGEWVFTAPEPGSAITVVDESGATIWTFNGGGWSDDPISEINGVPVGQSVPAPGTFSQLRSTSTAMVTRLFGTRQIVAGNGDTGSLSVLNTSLIFTGSNVVLQGISGLPGSLLGGQVGSAMYYATNGSGTNLTIRHEDTNLSALNRINTPVGEDMIVYPGESFILVRYQPPGGSSGYRWMVPHVTAHWIQTRGPRIVALTDGSEITVNPAIGDVFTVSIEDNRTITISDGTVVGRLITLHVTQADGGGHAVTLAGNVEFSDVVADLSEVDTTNGAKARILLEWNGANWVVLGLVNSGGA